MLGKEPIHEEGGEKLVTESKGWGKAFAKVAGWCEAGQNLRPSRFPGVQVSGRQKEKERQGRKKESRLGRKGKARERE